MAKTNGFVLKWPNMGDGIGLSNAAKVNKKMSPANIRVCGFRGQC